MKSLSALRFPLVGAFLLFASLADAAQPLAQEYTVIFHNPDPERYVEGCGLEILPDGSYVAVVPVVPRLKWSEERRATTSRTHIVRSEDRGATWQEVSVLPYYSAIPWVHQGRLYVFANKGGTTYRNNDLFLLRSDDGGRTWSEPVLLFPGHFWNCHTGIVVRNNTLYAATDNLGLGSSYSSVVDLKKDARRGSCVVACDLTRDPMDPASWRMSNTVPLTPIPRELVHPQYQDRSNNDIYLEPSVIDVGGRLRVLAAVKPSGQTTANLAVVLDLADVDGKLDLRFTQYSPMPGGQLKFTVIRDDTSQLFWSTANLVVDSQGTFDWWAKGNERGNFWGGGGNDRRTLMLQYSLDGLNWFQAGCIAQAPKISQSFMYARPVVDGDDLVVVARTSINAPNQHDADHATFHRVRNFRSLALNLRPQSE